MKHLQLDGLCKTFSYIVTNWILNSFGRDIDLFFFYVNMNNTLLALVNNEDIG